MKNKLDTTLIIFLFLVICFYPTNTVSEHIYSTLGNKILKDGQPCIFRGINKMSLFGTDPSEINIYEMNIVRECIDLKITTDETIQRLVNNTRENNIVLILAGFWWDNPHAGGNDELDDCELSGDDPINHVKYPEILQRWSDIANLVGHEKHVWFNPWNEPTCPNINWINSARNFISVIRNHSNNIIVWDANAFGQCDASITGEGQMVLANNYNIVFSLHLYPSKWVGNSFKDIENRFQNILDLNFPFIVGEFGDWNGLCAFVKESWCDTSCKKVPTSLCENPPVTTYYCREYDLPLYKNVLEACNNKRISCLAWEWYTIYNPLLDIGHCEGLPDEILSDEICMAKALTNEVTNFDYTLPSNGNFTKVNNFYHKPNEGQIIIEMDTKIAPEWGSIVYSYNVESSVSIANANVFLQSLLKAKAEEKSVRFVKSSTYNKFFVRDIEFAN